MVSWVGQTLPTGTSQEGWQAACWDGTYFHLFDDSFGSQNKSLRSATAAAGSWSQQTFPAVDIRAASGFGSSVVAVGAGGNMARSSDNGTNWTSDTLPLTHTWVTIANNGSRFVAFHNNTAATNKAAYSDDGGANWTQTGPTGTIAWRKVLWTGTKFVAIGYDGGADRGVCSTSSDGATWSTPANIYSGSYDPIDAACIGGTVVVVAHVPTFEYIRSTDHGANWSRTDTGLTIISFGNTVTIGSKPDGFYVIGYGITQPLYSVDGSSWADADMPAGVTESYFLPNSIAANDDVIVAASNYHASLAMTIGSIAAAAPSPFFHFTFGM